LRGHRRLRVVCVRPIHHHHLHTGGGNKVAGESHVGENDRQPTHHCLDRREWTTLGEGVERVHVPARRTTHGSESPSRWTRPPSGEARRSKSARRTSNQLSGEPARTSRRLGSAVTAARKASTRPAPFFWSLNRCSATTRRSSSLISAPTARPTARRAAPRSHALLEGGPGTPLSTTWIPCTPRRCSKKVFTPSPTATQTGNRAASGPCS